MHQLLEFVSLSKGPFLPLCLTMLFVFQPVNIGGWQLKHVAGDDETVYKFHRNVTVKAGQDVTVCV